MKKIQKVTLRKIIFLVFTVILSCAIIAGATLTYHVKRSPDVRWHPQNIILLIGDGMGPNHIEVAKKALNKKNLAMESLLIQGKVTTFSKGLRITDSAAAASAMATGRKTWNDMVSQEKDGMKNENLTEIAIRYGMRTGVISSTNLYDATPAAFSSHTSSRENIDDIIAQQIASEIDLLIGEGKQSYDSHLGKFEEHNRIYINDMKELPNDISKNILCALPELPAEQEGENVLLSCTKYALEMLPNKEQDFFLMVEGAKIDLESHDNDINGMIKELKAFDEVVEYCLDYAQSDRNTCVIVVADHETGGLSFSPNKEISNDLYSTIYHTYTNIKYFFYPENIAYIPNRIDNTYIFRMISSIIKSR